MTGSRIVNSAINGALDDIAARNPEGTRFAAGETDFSAITRRVAELLEKELEHQFDKTISTTNAFVNIVSVRARELLHARNSTASQKERELGPNARETVLKLFKKK